MISNTEPSNTETTAAPVPPQQDSASGFTHPRVHRLKHYAQDLPWRDYAMSLGLVMLVTLVGLPFDHSFDHANIVMLYLLAEVIAATRFGLGPSIMAAVASVVAYHYFFILPRFTFNVDEAQYLLTFAGLLVVGLVISTLTARVREQARAAQRREAQTATSYEFSRALAAAAGLDVIVQAIVSNVKQVFNRDVVILLPTPESDNLTVYAQHPDVGLSPHEMGVADWVFRHGQPAGRGTATLPAVPLRYHPLKTARGVIGVLGVKPPDTHGHLTPDQYRLLEIFTSQAAVAIERAQLDTQAQQTKLLQEKEKLQTALLNSISHDLRTPLASITGVLSSLRDAESYLDDVTRRELVENACEEADRLNRLVANLLDMTRLQAGAVKAGQQLCDVQDIIGVVLTEMADKLKKNRVTVDLADDLPLIPMDYVLMTRVFINLIDNAHKYSAPGAPIEIRATSNGNRLEVKVADRGIGIPPEELARVFEKFYRVRRSDGAGGTGLGLSICRGIVELHGGQVWASNRPGGGTVVTVSLPIDTEPGGVWHE